MKKFIQKYERPLKTFVEGFLSYIALNIATADMTSKAAIKALIVGAIASAISLAINGRGEKHE